MGKSLRAAELSNKLHYLAKNHRTCQQKVKFCPQKASFADEVFFQKGVVRRCKKSTPQKYNSYAADKTKYRVILEINNENMDHRALTDSSTSNFSSLN